MRKRVILLPVLLALVIGLVGGFALRHFLPSRSTAAIVSTLGESIEVKQDNASLVVAAAEVARAVESEDFLLLSTYVHPKDGVCFTPNSTVDPEANLTLTAAQIAQAALAADSYIWGTSNETATPINLTIRDYLAAYVWDQDYLDSAHVGIDTLIGTGTSAQNVAEAYPEDHFVEFYRPGTQGDWSSLKLVFRWYQGQWYLVGVIHSAWNA